MAGRPVDHGRRAELLDAAVDHAAEHGFSELSWRTIAAALGVSTTTLVHHFGSKEQMLEAILDRLHNRMAALVDRAVGERPDVAAVARAIWESSADPKHHPTFKLFFAVYGHAVQAPERFERFLGSAGQHLSDLLTRAYGPDADPGTVRGQVILIIATLRGLLLELLGAGDPVAVRAAAESFLDGLPRSG